jgi:hypothetical protein
MKITNQSIYVEADKKYHPRKISPSDIKIETVFSEYDGPLDGICVWNKKSYYFFSFDQLYDDGSGVRFPSKFLLFELSEVQKKEATKEGHIINNKHVLTIKEFEDQIGKLQPQVISPEQIVGWFEIEKNEDLFFQTFLEWKENN